MSFKIKLSNDNQETDLPSGSDNLRRSVLTIYPSQKHLRTAPTPKNSPNNTSSSEEIEPSQRVSRKLKVRIQKSKISSNEEEEMADKIGVAYYYHFRKDLVRPYGLAFDENFGTPEFMKKIMKTINNEFFNRPVYAVSEFSSTIHRNQDFIKEHKYLQSFIPEFLARVESIVPACKILDRQAKDITGTFLLFNTGEIDLSNLIYRKFFSKHSMNLHLKFINL